MTVSSDAAALRPVFIDGPSGRLFAVHYAAHERRGARQAALFIPPFAEEMNRSRRMAALQARAVAALGVDCLMLDLFGTGDSEGDFRDARLSHWLGDIAVAADWLTRRSDAAVWLWGLRLGGLLACAAAASQPDRFKHLLLWQPVTDAGPMLTQFLRIRVAASMAEGRPPEKTEELRAQLAGDASVEVAGYELSADLARALDGLRMGDLRLPAGTTVNWLEVGDAPGDEISPAGRRIAESWRKGGIRLSAATVSGDPFWTLQETTLAPELLTATTHLFQT